MGKKSDNPIKPAVSTHNKAYITVKRGKSIPLSLSKTKIKKDIVGVTTDYLLGMKEDTSLSPKKEGVYIYNDKA